MECLSLLNSEQFYRSSCKRYPDLMPYFTDFEARELVLNPESLLCIDSKHETFTYADTVLKEQILSLIADLMRIHNSNRNFSKADRRLHINLFLTKKSEGLLRLDSPSQQIFYKDGVLDLAITGYNEGTLYVYSLASKIHVNYFEFSYFFSACN